MDITATNQNETINKTEALQHLKSRGVDINLAELGAILSRLGRPLTKQTLAEIEVQLGVNKQSLPQQQIKPAQEKITADDVRQPINPQDFNQAIAANTQLLNGVYAEYLDQQKAEGQAIGTLAAVIKHYAVTESQARATLGILQAVNSGCKVDELIKTVEQINPENLLGKAQKETQKRIETTDKRTALLKGIDPSSWY